VLALSKEDLVLQGCDLILYVGLFWAEAIRSDRSALTKRTTEIYLTPSRASELLSTPGVSHPDLCPSCRLPFSALMTDQTKEEVHAIAGLPDDVTLCRAASLAAGIRPAALWASSDSCCDICACQIGHWADTVSYTVLSALMSTEPKTGRHTWCLQSYFAAAVTFRPISLPFLLSGFNRLASLTFEDGVMGTRDVNI
jgi:hypothetical protein